MNEEGPKHQRCLFYENEMDNVNVRLRNESKDVSFAIEDFARLGS